MDYFIDNSHYVSSRPSFEECDWLCKIFRDQARAYRVTQLAGDHSLCGEAIADEGISLGMVFCCHGSYFVDSGMYGALLGEESSQYSGNGSDQEEIHNEIENRNQNNDSDTESRASSDFSNWMFDSIMNLDTENDPESAEFLDRIAPEVIEYDRNNERPAAFGNEGNAANNNNEINPDNLRLEPEEIFAIPESLRRFVSYEDSGFGRSPQTEEDRFQIACYRAALESSFNGLTEESDSPSSSTGPSETENNTDESSVFTCPICLEEEPACFPYNMGSFRHTICQDCTVTLTLHSYTDDHQILSCPVCRRQVNLEHLAIAAYIRGHHVHRQPLNSNWRYTL